MALELAKAAARRFVGAGEAGTSGLHVGCKILQHALLENFGPKAFLRRRTRVSRVCQSSTELS